MDLAVQHHQKNNFQEAERLYNLVLKTKPDHFQANFLLGALLAQINKLDSAKQILQKAIKINPNYADAHFNLGVVFKGLGEKYNAIACYQKAIKINNMHAEANNNQGTAFKDLGEHKIAIICYQKAIQINPNHADAHNNLGVVFNELGDHQKAIKFYEKSIQINPNHSDAHNNLGVVFNELGEYQKAINCYEKSIQINPHHTGAHNNLGAVFNELGEYQKAIACYQKEIQINPNHADAYYNLGNTSKELGEYQNAIACYQKAIQINPGYVGAYNNLGNVFVELGEHQNAIACYQKAIEYDPDNLTSVYHLSSLKGDLLDSFFKTKIDKLVDNNSSPGKNLAYGNFLLSKYEFKAKNYEKEINYLLKGHKYYFESEYKKIKIPVEYWLKELPKIKDLLNFNAPIKNKLRINNEIKPIFIIGVPRCGSTLLEKIIASSSDYIQIGEETGVFINFFIEEQILQKQSISSNTENFQTKLLERYKQKGIGRGKNDFIFTDKSLENFFFIGLINEIFPNAKVINCKRDPLSSIISILKNNLFNISWAHNLDNIFKYFDIYFKMIEHFKRIFPNFIYELKYEELVNNPLIESKKLLEYCELPWGEKCLEFYKRKDLICKTTSNIQIRKPIYKNSMDKYQPYKKFMVKYIDRYSWFNW